MQIHSRVYRSGLDYIHYENTKSLYIDFTSAKLYVTMLNVVVNKLYFLSYELRACHFQCVQI